MPGALNEALKQSNCNINTISEALKEERGDSELRITQKASKKLISILKDEIDNQDGFKKVLKILSFLSQNNIVINQIVNAGPDLSSICDKMLSKAISSKNGDIYDQKSLIIIFDLINQSDKLKSQLCMSIQEYILTSIEQKTIHSSLLPKSMEILVSAVTHHQENRTFFIKNTSKEKIAAVFKLTKSTGNTMVQIFSVEFLWRVAIPMRMSNDEKNKFFGPYAQKLYSITASSFREGILNFIESINQERTDPKRILQVKIKDLMIGSTQIPGNHNLYFGYDSILLWVSKNSKFAKYKNDIELITLRNSDISGIGADKNTWYIGITPDYDTLPDFFDNSNKAMFFQVLEDDKTILNIAQERFGKSRVPKMPRAKELTFEKPPLTPKVQAKIDANHDSQKTRKKSATPKVMKNISNEGTKEKTTKSPDNQKSKLSPAKKDLNEKDTLKATIKKKKTEKKDEMSRKSTSAPEKNIQNLSSSSDSEDESSSKNRSSKKEKNVVQKNQAKAPRQVKQEFEIQGNPNKTKKSSKTTKKNDEKSLPPKKSNSESSDEDYFSSSDNSDSKANDPFPNNDIEEAPFKDQPQEEEIPPVKISGSFNNDFSSDDFFEENNSESEPNFAGELDGDNPKEQQIKIEQAPPIPPQNDNEIKSGMDDNRPKFITLKKRHEYTPEKWELDTFDELKNFGSAIRSRLSERHLMLNRAIEETVSQSLKEISEFMSRCDSDLDQLRNDFTTSSMQISNDINQKQKMVIQLGEQQSEHIVQMLHDCELLQKRAQELVKRFAQQKKALLTNQEKHIALFREDMRAEVKAAMTTKKRETSKKLVQKLVTLLDEL